MLVTKLLLVCFCMVEMKFVFSETPDILCVLKKQEPITAFHVLQSCHGQGKVGEN